MKGELKKYIKILDKINPLEIIEFLNLKTYSLIDNGDEDYILGWSKGDIEAVHSYSNFDTITKSKEYWFGYLSYDIKNETLLKSKSSNPNFHSFPDLLFFKASHVIIKKENELLFFGTDLDYKSFIRSIAFIKKLKDIKTEKDNRINLNACTSKNEYIKRVIDIKNHIQKGDSYELNYCINFTSYSNSLSPTHTYQKLKEKTKAPFSLLFSHQNINILSASPERFLNRKNNEIISQPIKGTSKRSKDPIVDAKLILELSKNEKELAENVMIVDLVRNDMSKIALKNSVIVKELCKVYSFKTVHQLISTIFSNIDCSLKHKAVIDVLFPMGSMTGAPKIESVKIIDNQESFKRGIYSGAAGVISPNNSFDFNVIIRTILFDSKNKNLSVSVGSAITIKSDPEQEYDECLLKLEAISSVL